MHSQLPLETLIDDRFSIRKALGVGGCAATFLCWDNSIEREVCLKLMPIQQQADAELVERFFREGQILASLNHPGIVKCFSVSKLSKTSRRLADFPADTPYLVLELVRGSDIQAALRTTDFATLKRLLVELATSLHYCHEAGIVHRDLKPENIILSPESGDWTSKIIDFGLSHTNPELTKYSDKKLTWTGELIGSPLYMSPEQCVGGKIDRRSDIYSLGCVFFHLISGAPLYQAENAMGVAFQHLNSPLPQLIPRPELPTDVAALAPIILKCLEKDPQDRFQTCVELANAVSVISGDSKSSSAGRSRALRFNANLIFQLASTLVAFAVCLFALITIPATRTQVSSSLASILGSLSSPPMLLSVGKSLESNGMSEPSVVFIKEGLHKPQSLDDLTRLTFACINTTQYGKDVSSSLTCNLLRAMTDRYRSSKSLSQRDSDQIAYVLKTLGTRSLTKEEFKNLLQLNHEVYLVLDTSNREALTTILIPSAIRYLYGFTRLAVLCDLAQAPGLSQESSNKLWAMISSTLLKETSRELPLDYNERSGLLSLLAQYIDRQIIIGDTSQLALFRSRIDRQRSQGIDVGFINAKLALSSMTAVAGQRSKAEHDLQEALDALKSERFNSLISTLPNHLMRSMLSLDKFSMARDFILHPWSFWRDGERNERDYWVMRRRLAPLLQILVTKAVQDGNSSRVLQLANLASLGIGSCPAADAQAMAVDLGDMAIYCQRVGEKAECVRLHKLSLQWADKADNRALKKYLSALFCESLLNFGDYDAAKQYVVRSEVDGTGLPEHANTLILGTAQRVRAVEMWQQDGCLDYSGLDDAPLASLFDFCMFELHHQTKKDRAMRWLSRLETRMKSEPVPYTTIKWVTDETLKESRR
jgi:serine/threonine protein kinase